MMVGPRNSRFYSNSHWGTLRVFQARIEMIKYFKTHSQDSMNNNALST